MFGIKIKNDFLILNNEQTYSFVKNNPLFDLDIPTGEYSFPLSIYLNDHNKAMLGALTRLQAVKEWADIDCASYFNGIPLSQNQLKFIRGKNHVIEANVKGGTSLLAASLKNTKLNEVNFGTFDTGTTDLTLKAHMQDTIDNPSAYNHIFAPIYSPEFKSGFVTSEQTKNVWQGFMNYYSVEALQFAFNGPTNIHSTAYVPLLKLRWVLKQIFANFGFTLDWALIENDNFSKLYLCNNVEMSTNVIYDRWLVSGTEIVDLPHIVDTAANTSFGSEIDPSTGSPSTTISPKPSYNPARILKFEFDTFFGVSFNPLGLFDLTSERFQVSSPNKNHIFEFSIDVRINTISAYWSPSTQYWHILDIYEDNELVKSTQVEMISKPNEVFAGTMEYTPVKPTAKIHFQYNLWFQSTLSGSTPVWYIIRTFIHARSMEIIVIDPSVLTTTVNTIDYQKHVDDVSCSDFFNHIRKRFGAYIDDIDYINKVVKIRQTKDILKISASSICRQRDIQYELESVNKRYVFEETGFNDSYAADPQNYASQFPTAAIGSTADNFEEESISLEYSPLFNHEIKHADKSYALYGCMNTQGKNYSSDSKKVSMRLGIYLGKQEWSNISSVKNYPLISGQNLNVKNEVVGNQTLVLDHPNGLFPNYLKQWFAKMTSYTEVTFELYQSLSDLKNTKNDSVDFYLYRKYLVKKLEYKFKGNQLMPVKATMIELL